jgi:hypothetical protein
MGAPEAMAADAGEMFQEVLSLTESCEAYKDPGRPFISTLSVPPAPFIGARKKATPRLKMYLE